MEHVSDGDTTCDCPQRLGKRTGGDGTRKTNRDYPDDSIIEIIQNTGKDPGNLRRLTVTHILVKYHQLTLV